MRSLVEKEVPTIVWWDYENLEISAGMNHGLTFERIVNHFKVNGFGGPVQFVVVVGYLDSPMPNLKMMKNTENIELIITNNFPRPPTAKKKPSCRSEDKTDYTKVDSEYPRTHNILLLQVCIKY
ncbi:hypothetical protein ISN45_Aa06g035420 [Arabidopsis thaliana x Arabidopsis arenosa]|uniref:NYN domain-containing protein n=1 Tax=Arabidopsis thaliana x Arabidopsis arenosa TaxID=1240361 RepID=A0A8T1Z2G5_9BRAS|nr:hypothetical protein ISN45_Aa06g035420 [Arabidopsis thaliana x Arabidopsis arenosa]